MKKLLFTLIFSIYCLFMDAQGLEGSDAQQNLTQIGQIDPVTSAARGFDNRYQGVKGKPYISDNWLKGTIELTTNQPKVKDIAILLDVHFHQFLVQKKSGVKLYLKPDFIEKVHVDSLGTFIPVKAKKLGKDDAIRYCVLLHETNDIQLLKMPYKRFIKADYQQAYSVDRRYDEFDELTYEYFLRYKDDYQKFKPKKKSFLKALPADLKSKIEKYAKSKKLGLNSDADFMDALKNGI